MKARVINFFAVLVLVALVGSQTAAAQAAPAVSPEYDLLLKGGHVIDARNNIDTLMDVAIRDGKIARVARAFLPRGRSRR